MQHIYIYIFFFLNKIGKYQLGNIFQFYNGLLYNYFIPLAGEGVVVNVWRGGGWIILCTWRGGECFGTCKWEVLIVFDDQIFTHPTSIK